MIHLHGTILSKPEEKLIKDWLLAPGCNAFLRYISTRAAMDTAKAGNALVELKNTSAQQDADEAKERAQEWMVTRKVIEEVKDPEHDFAVNELKPRPLS